MYDYAMLEMIACELAELAAEAEGAGAVALAGSLSDLAGELAAAIPTPEVAGEIPGGGGDVIDLR